jgi:hypothetical protein
MLQTHTYRGSRACRGSNRSWLAVAALALALALPANAAPPAGYLEANIGAPANNGSTTVDATTGVWEISGEGNQFDGQTSDQLYFVYKLVRNGIVTGRLVAQSSPGRQYVGVMARASLDANAAFSAGIMSTTSGVVQYIRRTEAGAVATRSTGGAVPSYANGLYLLLSRVGNTVQTFTSNEGRIWVAITPALTLPLGETAAIGFAVSGRDQGVVTTARFSNVLIQEGVLLPSAESAATKNVAFLAWEPIASATGYNIYRGAKDATPDKLTLLKTVAAPLDFFLDDSVTTESKRDFSYVIAGVFNGADNKPFEGPAVRVR